MKVIYRVEEPITGYWREFDDHEQAVDIYERMCGTVHYGDHVRLLVGDGCSQWRVVMELDKRSEMQRLYDDVEQARDELLDLGEEIDRWLDDS